MNKPCFLPFFYLFLLCMVAACGRKNVGITGNPDTPLPSELRIQNADFNYFTSSSKIKFSNNSQSISATANIRIKKDSIIWISLTPGLGIEAARGIITQDSLKFINRLNQEYATYDFKELSKKFNFDINYHLLQSVLLGDMPRPLEPSDQVKKQDPYFIVAQKDGKARINNFIDARLMKVERVDVTESNRNRRDNTLNLQYQDFQKLSDQLFPFKNIISLQYQDRGQRQKTQINIQHKKANLVDETLQFPFSIPSKYERQ